MFSSWFFFQQSRVWKSLKQDVHCSLTIFVTATDSMRQALE